jgi:hypothetical protein
MDQAPPRWGGTHTVDSRHYPVGRAVRITHVLGEPDGRASEYQVTLYYSSLAELDAMAAGLVLSARWHNRAGVPLRPDSNGPVSVYFCTR